MIKKKDHELIVIFGVFRSVARPSFLQWAYGVSALDVDSKYHLKNKRNTHTHWSQSNFCCWYEKTQTFAPTKPLSLIPQAPNIQWFRDTHPKIPRKHGLLMWGGVRVFYTQQKVLGEEMLHLHSPYNRAVSMRSVATTEEFESVVRVFCLILAI